MTRQPISPATRQRIYAAQCGACWVCNEPLGAFQIDHRQAVVHGGDNAEDNLRALCIPCHREKTRRDVGSNAKARRIAKGGKVRRGPKMKSRPFPKAKRKMRSR